jgi:hypothetical protein
MDFKSLERIGVYALGLVISREFEWIFREQPIADVGIDGQIELVVDNKVQGKLIAVQVKSGDSYLSNTKEGLVFYGENKHLDYWLAHSLPVLLVIYTPSNEKLRWIDIRPDNVERTKKHWKVIVPEANVFDKTSVNALLAVFDRAAKSGEYEAATSIARKVQHSAAGHVSMIVNDIAADLQIYKWYSWIEEACGEHIPALHEGFVDGARFARAKLPSWIFPKGDFLDVEVSASNMINKANYAVDLLMQKAEYEPNRKTYSGFHAYKRQYPNPDYAQDNREHVEWAKKFVASIKEFVKSANLFCDIVREQLDPSFLLKMGRLMFSDDMISWSEVPQYTSYERQSILKSKPGRSSDQKLLDHKNKSGISLDVDPRLSLKSIMLFNDLIDRAFGDGPCTCNRCKGNNWSECGYSYQHTFIFESGMVNRRFAITSASDVLRALSSAWLSYTKSELNTVGIVPIETIMEFVNPELQERLVPLLLACGAVRDIDGVLMLGEPSWDE